MDLKQDIFKELKSLGLRANEPWVFQKYNIFRSNLSYKIELDQFLDTMESLCVEGYFEKRELLPMPIYILTRKCELYINNID